MKPVEKIEAGDSLAARNQYNKKTQWRLVLQTFATPEKEAVHVEIEHTDGVRETISCTTEHPFYVTDKGWCGANGLQSGDSLELLYGGRSKVVAVVADPEKHTVYNFEVADDHTYFVGERGIWVHNASRIGEIPSAANKIPLAGEPGFIGPLMPESVLANRRIVADLNIPIELSSQQLKHLPPVTDGRSVLNADPEQLMRGLRNGEFDFVHSPKPGQAKFDFGRPIGEYWTFDASGQLVSLGPTNYGSVRFGKKGFHIIPANPNQW